jgi:hypothetical protein
MTKIKVCGCYYDDAKGKRHFGIHVLNRRTNTFTILNKKLEKVTNVKSVVTCESSIGNIIMDIV